MEEKGSKLLKVISILMIIGGILSAIGSVLMVVLAGATTAALGSAEVQAAAQDAGVVTGTISALVWVAVVIMVISSVIEIIAGVKGNKNWNNPAQGKSLMIWGIICAALSLGGNILFATSSSTSIISIICGLVIPVLYIIGTVQLQKQA